MQVAQFVHLSLVKIFISPRIDYAEDKMSVYSSYGIVMFFLLFLSLKYPVNAPRVMPFTSFPFFDKWFSYQPQTCCLSYQ